MALLPDPGNNTTPVAADTRFRAHRRKMESLAVG